MPIGSVDGVAAAFTVIDEFSEPLARVEEQIAALQDSLGRLSSIVDSTFRDIGTAADAIARAAGMMDRMAAVTNDVATALTESAGRMDYAVYKAFQQAIETQYHVTSGVESFDPASIRDPNRLAADQARMLDLARTSAMGTIFTTEQTAQSYDMLAAMLRTAPAFQGADRFQNFTAIAPIILRASEVASIRGLGSLEDNMRALVSYAHLTGAYAPQAMTRTTDQLLSIAEATGLPFGQLENIMRMSIPMAHSVDASVSDTALFTTALIQGGLGGSSGFSMGQIFSGLLQTGGPISASLQGELESVNRAMGGNGHRFARSEMNQHIAALVQLGLMNSAGQLSVLDANGGVDIAKVVADIDTAGHRMSPTEFGNALRNAFSMRGEHGAALLAVMDQLTPALFSAVNSTPGAAAQQAEFAATPLQQFEQMLARLQDIGNVLATTLLPALSQFLGLLVQTLDVIDNYLAKHHRLATVIASAGAGAAGGFAVGGLPGAMITGGGAAVGAYLYTEPAGPPIPHGMPGAGLSQQALLGRRDEPGQVTVNAPLTVTVQGDMLGDYASLTAFLNQWWRQNAGAVGNSVQQQIRQMQRQSRRSTMQDMQQADGYTAAIASGAGIQ